MAEHNEHAGEGVHVGGPLADLLWRLHLQEDDAGWCQMVAMQSPLLRAVCARRLHDADLIDDALQDAFLEIRRSLPRFRRVSDAKAQAWLNTIAERVALNRWKAEHARRRREEVVARPHPVQTERFADDPRWPQVLACIPTLPPQQRHVIELRFIHGFSTRETARVLGTTPQNVKKLVNRALSSIRARLGARADTAALLVLLGCMDGACAARVDGSVGRVTRPGLSVGGRWALRAGMTVGLGVVGITVALMVAATRPAPVPVAASMTQGALLDPAPRLIAQSCRPYVLCGRQGRFWVHAVGEAPLAFRWQRWSGGPTSPPALLSQGGRWEDVVGADGPVYNLPGMGPEDDSSYFRCIVSNDTQTVTGRPLRVRVHHPTSGHSVVDAVRGQSLTIPMPDAGAGWYRQVMDMPTWLQSTGDAIVGTPTRCGLFDLEIRTRVFVAATRYSGTRSYHRVTVGVRESANPPPVIRAIRADAQTVDAGTVDLTVEVADDGPSEGLICTWTVDYDPQPPHVRFEDNATVTARQTTAHFPCPGEYRLRATVHDDTFGCAQAPIDITVMASLTALDLHPAEPLVPAGRSVLFAAAATNQFGQPMMPPCLEWTVVHGPGSIDAAGRYCAPSTAIGQTALIRVDADDVHAETTVTLVHPRRDTSTASASTD